MKKIYEIFYEISLSKKFMKISCGIVRFFKKEIEDSFDVLGSRLHTRFQFQLHLSPNLSNISVLEVEKVPVVWHSVIPNSKFQILDGAISICAHYFFFSQL
jgi:hypothetical protein